MWTTAGVIFLCLLFFLAGVFVAFVAACKMIPEFSNRFSMMEEIEMRNSSEIAIPRAIPDSLQEHIFKRISELEQSVKIMQEQIRVINISRAKAHEWKGTTTIAEQV